MSVCTAYFIPSELMTFQVYKFENVRFAHAPTGSLRLAAPATPTPGTPDPAGSISCKQVNLTASKKGLGLPYFGLPEAGEGAIPQSPGTEDCLFLDVYAPKSLFTNGKPTSKVPVVVWIHGGAFVAGAKHGGDPNNPLYTGVGALDAARKFNQNFIFVAGNYRLGAYGWLAGTYLETHGTPNAGLLDQHFLLNWTQNYIGQVGGNPSRVSAWGESAGGSSILHQLILNDGDSKPLFSRAILQSPAYQLQWDRDGVLNTTYNEFASGVCECPSLDIDCLRSLPLDAPSLDQANNELIVSTYQNAGLIPFGPAVDGKLITRLPANEFATKRNISLDSIMISHVQDEAKIFVPKATADNDFTTFVSNFMPQPTLAPVRERIAAQYPAANYKNVTYRLNALIRDASFVCNNWQLFQAYHDNTSTYMMHYNYSFVINGNTYLPALHATDLAPSFWNAEIFFWKSLQDVSKKINPQKPINEFVAKTVAAFYSNFSPKYQSYLVSHAVFGDPNKGSFTNRPWPTATITNVGGATHISNVHVAHFDPLQQFSTGVDDIIDVAACEFWQSVANTIDPATAMQRPPPGAQERQLMGGGERLGEP